jgi:hypothetical protein
VGLASGTDSMENTQNPRKSNDVFPQHSEYYLHKVMASKGEIAIGKAKISGFHTVRSAQWLQIFRRVTVHPSLKTHKHNAAHTIHSHPVFLWTYQSMYIADPSGRAVQGVGLRPFACWDRGFESHWGNGCLSLVSFVLSGRGLCIGLITRPEESYRVSYV